MINAFSGQFPILISSNDSQKKRRKDLRVYMGNEKWNRQNDEKETINIVEQVCVNNEGKDYKNIIRKKRKTNEWMR